MEINKTNQVKGVAFQGYQHKKTADGINGYLVNCMYDSNRYDCEFQCFKIDGKDRYGNYKIARGQDGRVDPFYTADVPKNGVMVSVGPWGDFDLKKDEPFAYRFALRDKNSGEVKYLREDDANEEGFSIINRKGTTPIIHGPMYQAMVDNFNPGYTFAGFKEDNTGEIIKPNKKQKDDIAYDIRNSVRTFSNTSGGTMAGLVVKLPDLREAGITRLVLTPLRGADKSGHKYWINNDNQLAKGIGNINDYNTLVRESFKNGINLVDDMAVTSEGLEGIHFQRAIKWMESDDKPAEYYYFKMFGIENGAIGLGVIPENSENLNHKLVNFPFKFKEVVDENGIVQYKEVKNKQYDPKQPSYIQIFDNSMVTDEERYDTTKVIDAYSTKTTDNKLAINTHDDTVFPYKFEVTDPLEIKKNIEELNEYNQNAEKQLHLNTPEGTKFVGRTSGYLIERKDVGGFVCWDSNTDMPKRNYFMSDYDRTEISKIKDHNLRKIEEQKIKRGNCEIQDVAVSAARHLVKHVNNVHNEYVAKTIGVIPSDTDAAFDKIEGILNSQDPKNPILPVGTRLDKEIVENIVNDDYMLKEKSEDYNEAILSSMMNLPLDSIEFAPDTQGALSSPYVSKRSPDPEHIKETRYEAMNDPSYKVPSEYKSSYNKMNNVFTQDIKNFADSVLKQVDKNSSEKLFDKDGNMTEYGQYVVPLVGEDIAKYAIVKALMPSVDTKVLKNGEIAYDYETMGKGSLAYIDVSGDSQKTEADNLVNKIGSGVRNLKSKDVDFVAKSINKRFENTNANSFKFAEVMVDRGGYGVDLRFDAAKDVVDMDSLRDARQTFDSAWKDCKTFWSNIMDVAKEENPNTTSFAEFTNIDSTKKIDEFLDETGVPTEANYSYFFDGITNIFGKNFTKPDGRIYNNDSERADRLDEVLDGFSRRPLEYKRNSYVFIGNHDKPRIIHGLSLDMELFHADLSNPADKKHRMDAYKIINDVMFDKDVDQSKINDPYYFNNVSSKAVANGMLLRSSIGDVNNILKKREMAKASSPEEKAKIEAKYDRIYSAFSKSIADVVNGKYYKNHPEVLNEFDFVPYKSRTSHDDLKTVNEKDGFGARSIPDAFDIVYDQACVKYVLNQSDTVEKDGKEIKIDKNSLTKKNLLEYRNMVDHVATDVGRAKTRIIMRYIGALTGNPTVYGGDELGMTGYEEKCKNVYLQNRNALDWSVVDEKSENKRKDIIDYRDAIMGIVSQRKVDEMNRTEGLNDGTMYKLDKMVSSTGDNVSGIISQAGNGVMNISLFNPNGINQDPNVKESNIHPKDMRLGSIYLKGNNGKMSLTPGTIFRNVLDRDKSIYKVYSHGDDYFIKREGGNNPYDGIDIELNDNNAPDGVMMLYHVPDDIQSERIELVNKKKNARQLYTQIHNIPNDSAYKDVNKSAKKKGQNIDITSEK